MTDPTEEPLVGGNISSATRVGDTVRRATGPWTPAVHALLRHLEDVGFDGSPRVFGLDDKGREVLAYIEGETPQGWPDPYPSWICDDATLASGGALLRRYHDAVEGFEPPPGATWRYPAPPVPPEIVCHNDAAVFNMVFRDRRAVAMFDWDHAVPATRSWDLAYLVWRWARLSCGGPDLSPEEIALRAATICRAYGNVDPVELVDMIPVRIRHGARYVEERMLAGDPPFVRIWSWGVVPDLLADAELYERERALFLSALR